MLPTPPLPNVEVARLAALSKKERDEGLVELLTTKLPLLYRPVRLTYADILALRGKFEFGEPGQRAPWSEIDAKIARKSRNPKEYVANRRVAKGLHRLATDRNVHGKMVEIEPYFHGIGQPIEYWSSMIIELKGYLVFPFFEPRINNGLMSLGCRVALSVMDECLKNSYANYHNVRSAVVQFEKTRFEARRPYFTFADEVRLFSADQIDDMVEELYREWAEIWETAVIEHRTGRKIRRPIGADEGQYLFDLDAA